ncbi:MAG TPA: complex I NDUFA9 subunit family protein [Geminicoccaceae bacterium]|nr:complex I NDUFA9 subunit family protein [Geminicoccaceae bacterium]
MRNEVVSVFGGTGFIGRHLVRRLCERHARLRVISRNPERGFFLKPMGAVGQIALERGDLHDDEAVARAVRGSSMVVNLVAMLYERRGRNSFQEIHVNAAGRIARAAAAAGVKRLVHVSAIGADPDSPSAYARTKAAGEAAVREAFPDASILRPSIVFGPENGFFNRFGAMARYLPALPLIGGGHTRFQPVYVGDVADAIVACLTRDQGVWGATYELGGPAVYTFRELMRYILDVTGRRRLLLDVPYGLASFEARFLELLPKPLLTRDQVELLKRDNVVSEGARTLRDLGIAPTPMEVVVPDYLRRYARYGHRAPSPGRR